MGRLNPFSRGRGDGPLIVRTIHRDEPQRADPIHKFFFRRATDLIITVSQGGRDSALERLALDADRVAWIPGAVDLERFQPAADGPATREKWKIAPEDLVVGMVAEMQPHRGHNLLIDTIEEVIGAAPRARYAFVGSGELKKKLKARIKDHPLRDRFTWFGVRMDDLPQVYRTMNVSVILAQGSDGACRAMLEAMASGLPVIGARVGAIAETIQPGRAGWLIDPSPPEAMRAGLAAAIKEGLANPERTAEMGRQARQLVEVGFTQRNRAELTLKAYERAAAILES